MARLVLALSLLLQACSTPGASSEGIPTRARESPVTTVAAASCPESATVEILQERQGTPSALGGRGTIRPGRFLVRVGGALAGGGFGPVAGSSTKTYFFRRNSPEATELVLLLDRLDDPGPASEFRAGGYRDATLRLPQEWGSDWAYGYNFGFPTPGCWRIELADDPTSYIVVRVPR